MELEYNGTVYRPPVEANTIRMLAPEEIEAWLTEMYRVCIIFERTRLLHK